MVSVQVPNIDLNSTRVQEIHDIQMSNLLISCTERSSGPVLYVYTYIFISLKRAFLYRTHKPQYLANLSDVTNWTANSEKFRANKFSSEGGGWYGRKIDVGIQNSVA